MAKNKTVSQQKEQESRLLMAAIGLECHLRNLIREIKAGEGDTQEKIAEFHEFELCFT